MEKEIHSHFPILAIREFDNYQSLKNFLMIPQTTKLQSTIELARKYQFSGAFRAELISINRVKDISDEQINRLIEAYHAAYYDANQRLKRNDQYTRFEPEVLRDRFKQPQIRNLLNEYIIFMEAATKAVLDDKSTFIFSLQDIDFLNLKMTNLDTMLVMKTDMVPETAQRLLADLRAKFLLSAQSTQTIDHMANIVGS